MTGQHLPRTSGKQRRDVAFQTRIPILRGIIEKGLRGGRWCLRRSIAPDLRYALGSGLRITQWHVNYVMWHAEVTGLWVKGWAPSQLRIAREKQVALDSAERAREQYLIRAAFIPEERVERIRQRWQMKNSPGHLVTAEALAAECGITVEALRQISRGLPWRHA